MTTKGRMLSTWTGNGGQPSHDRRHLILIDRALLSLHVAQDVFKGLAFELPSHGTVTYAQTPAAQRQGFPSRDAGRPLR